MAKKEEKTNAMRLLERAGVPYTPHTYDASDGHIDGAAVARKCGQNPADVYKTLVTHGADGGYYVFVVPVEAELDLKAAARAAGVKSVAMIPVADINRVTGYVRGGCSPVGMKKNYPTYFDQSALGRSTIFVSGGRIGTQVEVQPTALLAAVSGKAAPLIQA